MSIEQRAELRAIQDVIVNYYQAKGRDEYTRLSVDLPADITLFTLKQFIYPAYYHELKAIAERIG